MFSIAKEMKADALVTGHYVEKEFKILKKLNFIKLQIKKKIKVIFLFATTKSQLDYLRFPLGNYSKKEVRKLAKELNLSVTDKKR